MHGRHPNENVRYGEFEADIDVDIAPLVLACWRAGILTTNSCQNNPAGWVWLQFGHALHAEAFLNLVAEYEEGANTFYNRVRLRWADPVTGENPEGAWEYSMFPDDLSVRTKWHDPEEDPVEAKEGPTNFVLSISIRFPQYDLPTVLRRVERAIDAGD